MTAFKVKPGAPNWQNEHMERYLATDGAEGYYMDFTSAGGPPEVPTLLLTTTGRRSGKSLMLPLIFGESGTNTVIIASKGGAPEHPAWYTNLVANPEVGVQIKGHRFRAKARTATGSEREALWKSMAALYPPYDTYQTRTAREIPVVVLEPLAK